MPGPTPQDALLESATAMHAAGTPLMRRIVPPTDTVRLWDRYPVADVVNGPASSRYFYHCHPSRGQCASEHGHFHLFLGKHAMPKGTQPLIAGPRARRRRADAVHVAALAMGADGLPIRWFTTNRWVTDEWLFPAAAIAAALPRFDLDGTAGDPLVNAWLTALVRLSQPAIGALLVERDALLAAVALDGEDRAVEETGSAAIDLAALLD